jgi:TrmH family RNA methyltransferase
MVISSLTNEKIKNLGKLNSKKYRLATGLYVVEGKHMIQEAIACGLCLEVYTSDLNYDGFTSIVFVDDKVMKKISQVDSPQGIIAVCTMPKVKELHNKVLLLDGLSDPGNLGTLIRSALAFGFMTIVAEDCVDITNPKVLRSTQGAFFKINFLEMPLTTFINVHPEYTYFGTDLHGGLPLAKLSNNPAFIGLILGNEAIGVRPDILSMTEKNLFVEIEGIESLNVAVAGSILMYYLK